MPLELLHRVETKPKQQPGFQRFFLRGFRCRPSLVPRVTKQSAQSNKARSAMKQSKRKTKHPTRLKRGKIRKDKLFLVNSKAFDC